MASGERCCVLLQLLSIAAAWNAAAPLLPKEWRVDEVKPQADQSMPVLIFLNTRQQPLVDAALRVSDPLSSEYGAFLSKDQMQHFMEEQLLPNAKRSVEQWLAGSLSSEKIHWGPTGDSVHLQTSVKDVETLFETQVLRVFSTEATALRAGVVHVPDEVSGSIASVFGVHGLPLPQAQKPKPADPSIRKVTPALLREVYKFIEMNITRSDANRRALAEFQRQWMDQDTLTQFFNQFVKGKIQYESGVDNIISKFVGTKYHKGAGVEALLDVEYMMGTSPGPKTEFWAWQQTDFCSDLAHWTEAILKEEQPPLVHSVSYGYQGNLSNLGCSLANVAVVNRNLQKLALRGISIIVASGDTGSAEHKSCSTGIPQTQYNGTVIKKSQVMYGPCCASCSERTDCGAWFWDGIGCTLFGQDAKIVNPVSSTGFGAARIPNKDHLWPSWPASSPWVTAVGSTRFIDQKPSQGEMATDQFGSGGGFSYDFAMPAYQKEKVQEFFKVAPKEGIPPTAVWAKGGRATPDVSALGEGYQVSTPGDCNLAPDGTGYTGTPLETLANITSFDECCQACPSVKGCKFFNQEFDTNSCKFFGADAKKAKVKDVLGGLHPGAPYVQSVGGTSASTPVFAGIVSLLNDARLAHGKKPLGFLNPWLYQNPHAFTDVTVGSNRIDRDGNPLKYGWDAVKGWDPATGLGTPRFDKLLAAALQDQSIIV